MIALSGAENFADASCFPIPPVAGQTELRLETIGLDRRSGGPL